MPGRTKLSDDMLDFLCEPRTRADIRERFGSEAKVRATLQNLVARGEAKNLNAGNGCGFPGLFVRREDAPRRRRADESLDFRTGAHLGSVWFSGGMK